MNENKQGYFTENLQEKEPPKPIHNYKDRVFRMIFKDQHKLLELYNAINGTAYQDPDEMTITTLEIFSSPLQRTWASCVSCNARQNSLAQLCHPPEAAFQMGDCHPSEMLFI